MTFISRIHWVLLGVVLAAGPVWGQPSQVLAAERARSERLAQIYEEASLFHFSQLEDFYLPELSKSSWLRGAQRTGVVLAVFPALGACAGLAGVCAEVVSPLLFFGMPLSMIAVGVEGLYTPLSTSRSKENFLRERPQPNGWPEEILEENVDGATLFIFGELHRNYIKQVECSVRYEAYLDCRAFTLPDVEAYLRDFGEIYKEAVDSLRERVTLDPSISLEVNNLGQYLNKPGRYLAYFKYMSLISYLEGSRYAVLADLHRRRVELLEIQPAH